MRRNLKALFIPLSALLICVGSGFSAWHFSNINHQESISIQGNGTIEAVSLVEHIGEMKFNCSTFSVVLDDTDKQNGNIIAPDGKTNIYCGVNFFSYDDEGNIISDDNNTDVCESDVISTFVPNKNFFDLVFRDNDYKIKFILEPYTKSGTLYEGLLKFIKFGFGRDETTYIANSNELIKTKEELSNPDNLVFPAIRGSYINLAKTTGIFKPTTLEEYTNYVELLKSNCGIETGDIYDFKIEFDLRITMIIFATCPDGHIDQQFNTKCSKCGKYVGGDSNA